MVKGILKRLFPVLCCIVVLISCMVVPASASGPTVVPNDVGSKLAPYISGSVFFTAAPDLDQEYQWGTSVGLADVIWRASGERLASYSNVQPNLPYTVDEPYAEFNIAHYVSYSPRVIGSGSDPYEYDRLVERFKFVTADGSLSPMFPFAFTFHFDGFGGTLFLKDYIRNLFWLHGRYNFVTSFDFSCVHDNRLFNKSYEFTGSANGEQSVLYGSMIDAIKADFPWLGVVSENSEALDFFYFDNLTISVTSAASDNQDLVFSRPAFQIGRFAYDNDSVDVSIDYPIKTTAINPFSSVTQHSLKTFLTRSNLITGPSVSYLEGGEVTDFLSGAASSVLDAKLFGDFTLGGVLAVILAVSIVFWLMKVFAGG